MTIDPADATVATSQDRRREIRMRHHDGLDFVEVHEDRAGLTLMFLEQVPQHIRPGNIRIDGPAAQPALTVASVRRVSSSDPKLRDHLLAQLSGVGGEGVYRVSMVESRPDGRPGTVPLRGLDPRFVSCTIRFDIDGPAPIPVNAAVSPTPPATLAPSYLARDYEALRTLLLDRLTRDVPDWSEQHPADLVVMLIELFAFLGDDLSYYQDAVATEAYLETARRRTSIRRHARLVGYPFHEGCHARTWIDLQVNDDCELALGSASFTAQTPTQTVTFSPLHAALPRPYAVGETPAGQKSRGAVIPLRRAHNEIGIYSWGESTSYLPQGATEAALVEPNGKNAALLQLQTGDLLMFEETQGADGGPADETHRHVVRLTRVESTIDPLFGRAILEVAWDELDALPFQLPVTTAAAPPPANPVCSVARANLVLVGEGRKIANEPLDLHPTSLDQPDLTWSCPYPDLDRVAVHQAALLRNLYHAWREQITRWRRRAQHGQPLNERQRAELTRQFGEGITDELGLKPAEETDPDEQAGADATALWILLARADDLLESRIHRLKVLSRLAAASGPLSGPVLAEIRHDWGEDVTQGLDSHHPASWGPAADATTQDPTTAQPLLTLADEDPTDTQPATQWEITTGLVDAEPETTRVVVEMEENRSAGLRFNPATEPHGPLAATYFVGNGSAGNVAAETITSWNGAPDAVESVRNPLPATGGTDPETLDHARRAIPGAYLNNQPRALTPADYIRIASTVPGVRKAAATPSWSGNRLGIRVAVQPSAGEDPGRAVLQRVEHTLLPARRIGHDLSVTPPDYCPVAISLTLDLDAYAIRDTVREQIAELLSSGQLSNGQPAFFNPSHFTFGKSLYQSALIAAVQDAAGVVSVSVTELRFVKDGTPPVCATLDVSATAIIRCDNDPAAPENGYAHLTMVGGR